MDQQSVRIAEPSHQRSSSWDEAPERAKGNISITPQPNPFPNFDYIDPFAPRNAISITGEPFPTYLPKQPLIPLSANLFIGRRCLAQWLQYGEYSKVEVKLTELQSASALQTPLCYWEKMLSKFIDTAEGWRQAIGVGVDEGEFHQLFKSKLTYSVGIQPFIESKIIVKEEKRLYFNAPQYHWQGAGEPPLDQNEVTELQKYWSEKYNKTLPKRTAACYLRAAFAYTLWLYTDKGIQAPPAKDIARVSFEEGCSIDQAARKLALSKVSKKIAETVNS